MTSLRRYYDYVDRLSPAAFIATLATKNAPASLPGHISGLFLSVRDQNLKLMRARITSALASKPV